MASNTQRLVYEIIFGCMKSLSDIMQEESKFQRTVDVGSVAASSDWMDIRQQLPRQRYEKTDDTV